MKGLIYCAENNINGKVYIGQTIDFKVRKRIHYSDKGKEYFHNALRKYNKEDFTWSIIQEYEADDKLTMNKILNKAEIYYIEAFDSFKNGYNMTKGGDGSLGVSGDKHWTYNIPRTEETKHKISETLKGNIPWNKGKTGLSKHSEEHNKKIAKSVRRRWAIQKDRKTLKGYVFNTVTCPHCGKSGGNNIMKRWHFDNCKEK